MVHDNIDFMRRFETGDWGTNPWYLDPESTWEKGWNRLGLPREKRVVADDCLRRIFPPEIVMGMKEDLKKWFGHVAYLFGGVTSPYNIADLLDLGVNADLARPWENKTDLRRLQLRRSHDDTAFEVAVHAGLLRAGAIVERIPEAPPEKRYDFRVEFRGLTYEFEVKNTGVPDLDRVARKLHSNLNANDMTIPGFYLVLRGSDSLAEMSWDNPAAVEAAIPEILEAYSAAAALIRSSEKPGHYPAGKWGSIEATLGHVHGAVEDKSLPDLPEEKKARRVLRLVRDGLEQLSGKHRGVLVIGLYRSAQPDLVERLLLRNEDAAGTLARKCTMIVLCDQYIQWEEGLNSPKRIPLFYAFSPLLVRQLRPVDIELAVAASSAHWAVSTRMDWERPGHISARLDSSRPTPMLVSLGSAEWKPGEAMTITFEGLFPTRKGKGTGDAGGQPPDGGDRSE